MKPGGIVNAGEGSFRKPIDGGWAGGSGVAVRGRCLNHKNGKFAVGVHLGEKGDVRKRHTILATNLGTFFAGWPPQGAQPGAKKKHVRRSSVRLPSCRNRAKSALG